MALGRSCIKIYVDLFRCCCCLTQTTFISIFAVSVFFWTRKKSKANVPSRANKDYFVNYVTDAAEEPSSKHISHFFPLTAPNYTIFSMTRYSFTQIYGLENRVRFE